MKIQKMSAICAGLACAAVSSFAEELTVAEGSPVTLTSHQQYSAINLYDKLTVGVGGRVLVSPPPPITILGDKGGIVKDGGALPGTMTITIPATGGTFSDGAIVDVLTLNASAEYSNQSFLGNKLMNANASVPARIVFNGASLSPAAFGTPLLNSANGGKWILEATNGHDIVFGDLNLQHFYWLSGTGSVETRGNGSIVIYDSQYSPDAYDYGAGYRGRAYMNQTTTADWWHHAGDLVVSNTAMVICQANDCLPFGPNTGIIRLSWDTNKTYTRPMIDLGGHSVSVNGIWSYYYGHGYVTNRSSTVATLKVGADNGDRSLYGIRLLGGNIGINKVGTGTTTCTLGDSKLNNIAVTSGTLRFNRGESPSISVSDVTVQSGTTLILDGVTLKASTANVAGTIQKLNGGELVYELAGGTTAYDSVGTVPTILKSGSGQGIVQLPEVYGGDLRVAGGSVIFSGRQCTNEFYKIGLFGFQQNNSQQIALGDWMMFAWSNNVAASANLAKGITPGAEPLAKGRVTATFATTTTKNPSNASVNLWDIRNLFDNLEYNGVLSASAYTLSQSAMQSITFRMPEGKNSVGCFLPYNSYQTWSWHPGSWFLYTSADGSTWTELGNWIGQYKTGGGALNGGKPYMLNLKGMVFPNAYGLSPSSKVSVASGASVDFANVTSGQVLSKIEVDCTAGSGAIANFTVAESGTIYLKNVSSLLAFQTASIPVTLTGVVAPSRFSGWEISADGTVQRNCYLQYRDGGLYLVPDGTVVVIR